MDEISKLKKYYPEYYKETERYLIDSKKELTNKLGYRVELDKDNNQIKWFKVDYLSMAMRKYCAIRMIGKEMFYRPLRHKVYA